MQNMNSIYSIDGHPYIIVNNETVTEISQLFADMTEYLVEELLNKSLIELFRMLRVGPSINAESIDEDADYFLFTKSLEARLVNIKLMQRAYEKTYVVIEKPNSSFDIKFPFINRLCSDNYYGIGIFSLPDITLLKANETYIGFFDEFYNRKENCIGMRIDELVTGFRGSAYEDNWNTVLKTGKTYHVDECSYDIFERGTTYWNTTLIPLFEDGKLKYCLEMATEITKQVLNRKKIEEQARVIEKQKRELEAIIDSMPDGLELTDDKMHITLLNQSAKAFFNNTNENVKPEDLLEYNKYYYGIDGEEIPREDLPTYRVFNKGSFQNYILTVDRPDKKIYASINGSPIYNNDGTAKEAILCIRDMTEQVMKDNEIKHHQEAALQAEREKNDALEKAIEMKDEFLSLISHEFRTPLNVVNTAIQALNFIYCDEMTDKVKEYIGTIRQNTFRQLRLVNNLLDITRANAGHIKINKRNIDIVFLTKAITESVYQYASQKGVRITFVSSFREKIIGIDDEKYERIILNLLSNAIKFTPEGKSIVVNLRSVKGSICIEVKDTGIGIPPNKMDLIFERFGQVDSSLSRRAEGTGIGLALVKKFVEALGGSVSVKSKVGKSSTFTVLLPNEKVVEEHDEKPIIDLLDNRLIHVTNVELSDIYL